MDPQAISAALRAHQAGELEKAEALYRRILLAEPGHFDAAHLLGVLLLQSRRLPEAVAQLERAVAMAPGVAAAHSNLGEAYRVSGRAPEAIDSFSRAVSLGVQAPAVHFHLGTLLAQAARFEEAIGALRRATELKPDLPEAHCNLGNACRDQGDGVAALAAYRRALELRPEFAEAHLGAGSVLREQGRLEEAAQSLSRALAANARLAEAHEELGHVRTAMGEWREALACFGKAIALEPDDARPRWAAVMAQVPAIEERGVDADERRQAFARELGEFERWLHAAPRPQAYRAVGVHQPFYLAYHEASNRELLSHYGRVCDTLMRPWQAAAGLALPGRRSAGPIRVGIASAHVFHHSVWSALTRGWVEHLDRRRFELHVFSLGAKRDEETQRARAAVQHFHEGARGFEQWARLIHAAGLDVLVYPEVGMDATTAKLASLRLAPVQAVSWGHPETSGLPSLDYYLSAAALEPSGAQAHYSEQLVMLPGFGCRLARSARRAPGAALVPLEGSPLLVCPSTPFKLTARHDAVLIAIARRLPRARLVFFRSDPPQLSLKLEQRLRLAFAAARVDFDRHVAFIPWQTPDAFRGLLARADLYLDTLGFSGFNTALQALECGLPIVAREGRFLRGRLASGLVRAIGLDELVATSDEEYIELVVALANDRERRAALRRRIEDGRERLYEDPAPVEALERFFEGAARR